jgi:hypothetical protein
MADGKAQGGYYIVEGHFWFSMRIIGDNVTDF